MGTRIYDSLGAPIHKSRNLRGLLDYARNHVPLSARLEAPDVTGKHRLCVYFDNGSSAFSDWLDWSVCADWLARRRSWPRLKVSGHARFVDAYNAARPS